MSVDVRSLAINYIQANEEGQLTAHFRQDLLPTNAETALLLEQLPGRGSERTVSFRYGSEMLRTLKGAFSRASGTAT